MKPNPVIAHLSIARQKLVFKSPSLTLSSRVISNGLIGFLLALQAILFYWIIARTPEGKEVFLGGILGLVILIPLGIFFIWDSRQLNKLKRLDGHGDASENKKQVLQIADELDWKVAESNQESVLMILSPAIGYRRQVSILFDQDAIWMNISPFIAKSWRSRHLYPGSYFGNRKLLRVFERVWEEGNIG